MAIYDGVVTLADEEVPVIVELDHGQVRMSASGTEIGHWRTDECEITHVDDTVYSITAENESLRFVPNQPSLFAAGVDGMSATTAVTGASADTGPAAQSTEKEREAPPAKPLTMGLFYALCLVTAALAVWALVSILL